jgi:23S rRNA pseudouridine1911/1915/1917 synthase
MARNRGFTYRDRIGGDDSGTTVLDYLVRRYRHSGQTVWRERIERGQVVVDGSRTTPDARIGEGTEVAWIRPPWREPDVPCSWALLYRDDHVLAVAKPAGLPTMPAGGFLENTLLALVRRRHPEAVVVHRLGRWTSGVVMFARTRPARAGLARGLRRKTVWKRYRALASGRPTRRSWVMAEPIGLVPHAVLGTVHAASDRGRPARSEVRVLEVGEETFLADVVIATGRPHQIRIHLAASGHPLVGDPLYPAGGVPRAGATALPGDPGYRLHAAEIRTAHPVHGKPLCIECAPPPVLRVGNR